MRGSPQTRFPCIRARRIASCASSQETWTTYSGTPAISAIIIALFVASPSTWLGREYA